ncbi:MAG: sugar ABC transporter permease [Candidatus Limiplasma sp.]|nr:sugar ABC transporter permease [Candidatus Limiplasma sp.]
MDRVLRDKWAILAFVLPALLVFSAVVILPIVFSGYYSLLEWNGAGQGKFIGFQNYVEMFTNPSTYFVKGIVNSAILAALSIFVQVPLALGLALLISRGIRLEGLFRNVYFIPVIISTTVIGQLWMKIYHPNNGMLNVLLTNFGLEAWKRNWLADPTISLGAVFFVLIWQYIGYHMLLLYSSIKAVPTSLYEAAEIDGCSRGQLSRHITIPLIMPMIKVCITFALIGSLKTFDLIYVLTKGGPIHATEVPTTLMFSNIFLNYRYGLGSSMAIFILLECLVFTVCVQRLFKVEDLEF